MKIKILSFILIFSIAAILVLALSEGPREAFAGAIDDVRASLKADISSSQGAVLPGQFAETEERTRGVAPVSGRKAFVREAAWTGIIGTVRPGDAVEILGEEGDWYVIEFEGRRGYVLKQDLDAVKDYRANKKLIGKSGVVKGGGALGLPVRDGKWGDKTGSLADGARVKITGIDGDWYRVEYEGGSGYVRRDRINLEKGGETSEPGKPDDGGEPVSNAGGDRLCGWLREAGFEGQSLRVAWAIAMRESSGKPDLGPGNPYFNGYDWGLFQFNKPSWGKQSWWDDKKILDPVYNAKVAFDLSKGGTYWLPWGLTPDGKAMDAKCYPMWSAEKQMAWIWKPYKEWYDKFPGGN